MARSITLPVPSPTLSARPERPFPARRRVSPSTTQRLSSQQLRAHPRCDLRLLAHTLVGGEGDLMVDTSVRPAFGSWQWRLGNAIVALLARAGVGPIHLLTTRSRRTGRPHTIPVVPVEHAGRRWLVAPYGTVSWVRDVREDGHVRLRFGRTERDYATREAGPDEAGAVLKRYVAVAAKTRSHFRATKDAPVEDFVAEAKAHPAFELIPVVAD